MAITHRIHDALYLDLELESIKRIRPAGNDKWSIDTDAGDILVKEYPLELVEVMASVIRSLQKGE